jgi:hypothetical protein
MADIPALVQAYLEYNYGSDKNMDTEDMGGSVFHVIAIHTFSEYCCGDYLCNLHFLKLPPSDRECLFSVHQQVNKPANVSLIRQGLLGCSPVEPSVAFSFNVLELHHRLRRYHSQPAPSVT